MREARKEEKGGCKNNLPFILGVDFENQNNG